MNECRTAAVLSADESREYWFHEGCHILELSNSNDDQALSIARARVAPGVTTQSHRLVDTVERYVILSGSGTVTIGTLTAPVCSGDTVIIPAGTPQQIRNDGDCLLYTSPSPRDS